MLVSGSVLDKDFGIVPFANVTVVGENQSTTADENGKFSILASSSSSVLRFSHAGFDYDEITVAEFKVLGYILLYRTTLGDATVINDHKSKDNTLAWILGAITTIGLIALLTRKKAVDVKA